MNELEPLGTQSEDPGPNVDNVMLTLVIFLLNLGLLNLACQGHRVGP